jgi:uncharacterized protein
MPEASRVHGYGLDTIVDTVRQHGGFTNKLPISTVRQYIDTSDPVHGPGDDGAIVEVDGRHIVACGEALAPSFVAADPYGAGIAAVLANVNDVAAMGGVPLGLVNTVVGPKPMLEEVMRGMRDAAEMYDVPIIGGHLTERAGDTSVSAFAVGHAKGVLSMAHVRPGQVVVFACFLDGVMRADFPFFTSIPQQTHRFAADVRVMAAVAASGAAVSAKDVSMAGALGSLAMLLEFRKFGADIDLTLLPLPADTDFLRWLICFPSYAFWLTCEPDRADECIAQFRAADLNCVAVGHVTDNSSVMLRAGTACHELINLDREAVTGLWA